MLFGGVSWSDSGRPWSELEIELKSLACGWCLKEWTQVRSSERRVFRIRSWGILVYGEQESQWRRPREATGGGRGCQERGVSEALGIISKDGTDDPVCGWARGGGYRDVTLGSVPCWSWVALVKQQNSVWFWPRWSGLGGRNWRDGWWAF